MKDWFVYMVICRDGSLYTGVSNDVKKRIEAHNLGKGAKYTKGRTPVRLVYAEKVSGKGEALKREAEIKRKSRKDKRLMIE